MAAAGPGGGSPGRERGLRGEAPPSDGDSPSDSDPEPSPAAPSPAPFRLRGASASFSRRSRDVFAGLEAAPRPRRPPRPPGPAAPAPPPVPDYVAHPERWTRYSLGGAFGPGEPSDRAAAPAPDPEPCSRGPGRVVFSRPARACAAAPRARRGPGRAAAGGSPVELAHLSALGAPEPEDGAAALEDGPAAEAGGFHGSRKRSREHLRGRSGGPEPAGAEDRED